MPKLPKKLRNLFKKKKKGGSGEYEQMLDPAEVEAVIRDPTKLAFRVQLAHGSPTAHVSNFSNIAQLYERLAVVLDVSESDMLFCTLNTYGVDMESLIGGTINMEDFIYVHVAGNRKDLTVNKAEPSIGITITDNGHGKALVKRVKPDSVASRHGKIAAGDHIVSINGESMVGLRHFEVAKVLKSLPLGIDFKITLVEPKREFDQIAPRTAQGKTTGASDLARSLSGRVSLRLRRVGKTTVQEMPSDFDNKGNTVVDDLLEQHLGIRDSEMATTILEVYKDNLDHLADFSAALKNKLLVDIMTDKLLTDVWAALGDLRKKVPLSIAESP